MVYLYSFVWLLFSFHKLFFRSFSGVYNLGSLASGYGKDMEITPSPLYIHMFCQQPHRMSTIKESKNLCYHDLFGEVSFMLKQMGFFRKPVTELLGLKIINNGRRTTFFLFLVEIYSCFNEKHQWNPCPLNASKNGY